MSQRQFEDRQWHHVPIAQRSISTTTGWFGPLAGVSCSCFSHMIIAQPFSRGRPSTTTRSPEILPVTFSKFDMGITSICSGYTAYLMKEKANPTFSGSRQTFKSLKDIRLRDVCDLQQRLGRYRILVAFPPYRRLAIEHRRSARATFLHPHRPRTRHASYSGTLIRSGMLIMTSEREQAFPFLLPRRRGILAAGVPTGGDGSAEHEPKTFPFDRTHHPHPDPSLHHTLFQTRIRLVPIRVRVTSDNGRPTPAHKRS